MPKEKMVFPEVLDCQSSKHKGGEIPAAVAAIVEDNPEGLKYHGFCNACLLLYLGSMPAPLPDILLFKSPEKKDEFLNQNIPCANCKIDFTRGRLEFLFFSKEEHNTFEPLCKKCQEKLTMCANCGDLTFEKVNLPNDGAEVCSKCYKHHTEDCSGCHKRFLKQHMRNHKAIVAPGDNPPANPYIFYCMPCHDANFDSCQGCGKFTPKDQPYQIDLVGQKYCGKCIQQGRGKYPTDVKAPGFCRVFAYNDDITQILPFIPPQPIVYDGIVRHPELFGWELEFAKPDAYREDFKPETDMYKRGNGRLILVHDGSIMKNGNRVPGFEVVSMPFKENDSKQLIEDVLKDNKFITPLPSCGMHIHMNKTSSLVAAPQVAKLFIFGKSPANSGFIQFLAGRPLVGHQHARLDIGRDWKDMIFQKQSNKGRKSYQIYADGVYEHKYQWLNVNKKHTVELRIFPSTLSPEEAFKNLEVMRSLFAWVSDSSVKLTDLFSPRSYIQFIRDNRKDYPNLFAFLDKGDVYKPYMDIKPIPIGAEPGKKMQVMRVLDEEFDEPVPEVPLRRNGRRIPGAPPAGGALADLLAGQLAAPVPMAQVVYAAPIHAHVNDELVWIDAQPQAPVPMEPDPMEEIANEFAALDQHLAQAQNAA